MAITLYVESVSIDTVEMKWLDSVNPSNTHEIHRSTDGAIFALVDTADAGDDTFVDSGLTPETRYWYKIVDGATESDEKSVITQVCFGITPRVITAAALPTAGEEVTSAEFNEAMRKLEAIVRHQQDGKDCVLCITNGSIVLNCTEGCKDFIVEVTEDINSISIVGCDDSGDGSIDFKIPANETRRICGFPSGFGFSGGECFDAPLFGGSSGRSVSIGMSSNATNGPRAKSPSGTGGTGTLGGGGGRSGGGPLTITCQTADGSANDGCSMDCLTDKEMRFRITGGRPPYTPSTNSGGTIAVVSSGVYSLTPVANAGSAVAGTAFRHEGVQCTASGGTTLHIGQRALFGCDDVYDSCSGSGTCSSSCTCNEASFPGVPVVCTDANPQACANCAGSACGATCIGLSDYSVVGKITDVRTAGMITDGCNPCGVSISGKTFSVVDAAGTTVVAVLGA